MTLLGKWKYVDTNNNIEVFFDFTKPTFPKEYVNEIELYQSVKLNHGTMRYADHSASFIIDEDLTFECALICLLYTSPSPRD